jgi:hypothetical protein
MSRATWVAGLAGFLGAVIFGTFNSQICIPCIAVVLGAAAGYFACLSMRPADQGSATRLGATTGALAGIGTLLGSMAGGLIGAIRIGPAGVESILQGLGVALPNVPVSPVTFYGVAVGEAACFGVVEVFIMALLGALAAMVWFGQTRGDVPRPA